MKATRSTHKTKSTRRSTKVTRASLSPTTSLESQKRKIANVVNHLPSAGVKELALFAEFLKGKFANTPPTEKRPIKLRGLWRDQLPLNLEDLRHEMRDAWRTSLTNLETKVENA